MGTMEPQGGNQRMFAMLETMREEQENLNRELAERVQEKTRWEEKTGQLLGKKESLEATLGALRRQEMLLDEELRHLKQELITCDSKVAAGVEELGAYTIILEKLNITKALIETKRSDIEEKMVKHGEAIIAAEKETKLGKLLERAQRTRSSVEAEIAAKVATHGSVEERRQARQKQEEEHWYLEDENQLLLQVIQERRGIVSKLEIEARMRENKAQAQVRRLKMRRDELLAMKQEPTQPRN